MRSVLSVVSIALLAAACTGGSAPPSGAAGGDLRGQYPAPSTSGNT